MDFQGARKRGTLSLAVLALLLIASIPDRACAAVSTFLDEGAALASRIVSAQAGAGDDGYSVWMDAGWNENAVACSDDSAEPGSIGRLVMLPEGTADLALTAVRVTVAGRVIGLPPSCAHASPVMTMRGVPAAVITIDGERVAEALAARMVSASALAEPALGNGVASRPALGAEALRAALASAEALFDVTARPNARPGKAGRLSGEFLAHRGVYLIIAADELAPPLADFIDWKTRSGFVVRVATLSETGTSKESIREYIRGAYQTWAEPPLYVLLVGDADGATNVIPKWDLGTSISDHPYACVDGDDFLPDLYIGRMSAKRASEATLMATKTVVYESAPDTAGGAPWHKRALTVAGNYNSTTPVALSRWIREQLLGIGYTRVDSVYWSSSPQHPWWNGAPLINARVNEGVGVVSYRGWALGDIGWQPPTYRDTDVLGLANGWKLPVVFSIVCHTGNFANPDLDCFGESWMKAGTVDTPRGGVAFVGTSEPWSHSRWNDRMMIGVFDVIGSTGEREMGRIVTAAKLAMIAEFPDEFTMEDAIVDPEESVEYYMHTYNLLGDPSLEIWTDTPRPVVLEVPATVPAGSNYGEVHVTDAGTSAPVGGARVALSFGDELIGYGVTDGSGYARVMFDASVAGPIDVVVTGENLYPAQTTFSPAVADYAFTCLAANPAPGGDIVPGQTVELTLVARNAGSQGFTGASVVVTAPNGIIMPDANAAFGPLAAGQEGLALDPISVTLSPTLEDGMRLRFDGTPTVPSQGALPPSEFWLEVRAPRLVCAGASDQGDQVFDQGETTDLVVTLRNEGGLASGALTAILTPVDAELATVIDEAGAFGLIAIGQEGANEADPFTIHVPIDVPGGQVIPFTLDITSAAGPRMSVPFNLVVGPHDFSVPVGPDAYGYYAYDSADIDYPLQAPVYDWIECSPVYGGQGTKLTQIYDNVHAQLVELPFSFQYYGATYDSILVSDNGWISFDTTYWYDIRNWSLPGRWGNTCQVAAFWDNLSPEQPGCDGIYVWHDPARHALVIEWSRLVNYEVTGDPPTTDDHQTFEILLCDPSHYATTTGDGEMIFQYKQVVNDDYTVQFSTVGIEDQSEEIGLLYSYSNKYADGAAPLSPGLAIKITTEQPVYQPLVPLYFTASWDGRTGTGGMGGSGPSVEVRWSLPASGRVAGVVLDRAVSSPEGWREYVRLHDDPLQAQDGIFRDYDSAPGASYRYRLSAIDAGGELRVAGETLCEAFGGTGPAVRVIEGGLASGPAQIFFQTGGSELRELAVYDLSGRRVADLRTRLAGRPTSGVMQWDGRDDGGQMLASGMYWVRMAADEGSATARVVIVR